MRGGITSGTANLGHVLGIKLPNITGGYDLTPIESEYLVEISKMVTAHTNSENPNFNVAQGLEKKGLIKLIGEEPMIQTALTNAGKEYIEVYQK